MAESTGRRRGAAANSAGRATAAAKSTGHPDAANKRAAANAAGRATAAAKPKVAIIMGSDSDLAVMSAAGEALESLGVPYELTIVSAHRTPERMFSYAKDAERRGLEVIVAGAGGAAHLPGMVASLTTLPVIGVPVRGSSLEGLDSLLSIVQMPRGVPVATVAINNAKNAGILAARILSIKYPDVRAALHRFSTEEANEVEQKARELESNGFRRYLSRQRKS